jgi:hypothetical protein
LLFTQLFTAVRRLRCPTQTARAHSSVSRPVPPIERKEAMCSATVFFVVEVSEEKAKKYTSHNIQSGFSEITLAFVSMD